MRALLWVFIPVVTSKDATGTLGNLVEGQLDKVLESLVFGEAAKTAAISGVMQIATKFDHIFASMDDLVKKDKTLTDKVGKFANAFRPVSHDVHRLVVRMESNGVAMYQDKVPWLSMVWHNSEYEEVPPAIDEIRDVFKVQLKLFDEVTPKYMELSLRAKELAVEANAFGLDRARDKTWYKWSGGGAIALGLGGAGGFGVAVGGAVATGGALATPVAVATGGALAAAGAGAGAAAACGAASVALTPIAIAYLTAAGLSVVMGSTGAYIARNNHEFAHEILQSALLLSDVMLEMDKLMYNQTQHLIQLRQKNEDVLEHTETMQRMVRGIDTGANISDSRKMRVSRLLTLLNETSYKLVEGTKAYRAADMVGQQAVWEALQKHAQHAKDGAASQNAIEV